MNILPSAQSSQLLSDLNLRMESSCQCELKHTATQAVFGMGSVDASLFFIGEAPGKNEDKLGKPFVGASGKFLDEMLRSISMRREDIYITNIVKYRPPLNRDPSKKEVAECAPWLQEEIRLIRPDIIITLGRHALNYFLPEAVISQSHGQIFDCHIPGIGTKKLYALYHPAAALYNGGMRQTLIEDFGKIPELLEEIGKTKNPGQDRPVGG